MYVVSWLTIECKPFQPVAWYIYTALEPPSKYEQRSGISCRVSTNSLCLVLINDHADMNFHSTYYPWSRTPIRHSHPHTTKIEHFSQANLKQDFLKLHPNIISQKPVIQLHVAVPDSRTEHAKNCFGWINAWSWGRPYRKASNSPSIIQAVQVPHI